MSVERFDLDFVEDEIPIMERSNTGEWVRYADYAELEAEVERLTKDVAHWKANYNGLLEMAEESRLSEEIRTYERDHETERANAAEALSRTGAVKVSREDIIELIRANLSGPTINHPDIRAAHARDVATTADLIPSTLEPAAPDPEDDDTCTCCQGSGWNGNMERWCDCEDGLAQLPAAPEGQQEARPVAWRVRPMPGFDWVYIKGDPDRDPALTGYEKQPVFTRPAEQAVTEAMVEALIRNWERRREDLNVRPGAKDEFIRNSTESLNAARR